MRVSFCITGGEPAGRASERWDQRRLGTPVWHTGWARPCLCVWSWCAYGMGCKEGSNLDVEVRLLLRMARLSTAQGELGAALVQLSAQRSLRTSNECGSASSVSSDALSTQHSASTRHQSKAASQGASTALHAAGWGGGERSRTSRALTDSLDSAGAGALGAAVSPPSVAGRLLRGSPAATTTRRLPPRSAPGIALASIGARPLAEEPVGATRAYMVCSSSKQLLGCPRDSCWESMVMLMPALSRAAASSLKFGSAFASYARSTG